MKIKRETVIIRKSFKMKTICLIFIIFGVAAQVYSHGMVYQPLNRGSMWRYGYNYPVNHNDDANFCGGFGAQWDQNGGKCGFCGDDWSLPQPRPSEHGGTYGLGVIPERSWYYQGAVLPATVNLTISHLGYFEFSICKMENEQSESDECFDKYPLRLKDGSPRFEVKSSFPKIYHIALRLPEDLSCNHCVFRWHYRAGDKVGTCEDGTTGTGCGPQETYRTCSDIAIRAS